MKKPVSHFITGLEVWKTGILGCIITYKLIASFVIVITISLTISIIDNISSGKDFLLKANFISLHSVIFLLILLSLIKYLEYRTKRSLNIKHSLHKLTHDIRDHQNQFYLKISSCNDSETIDIASKSIKNNLSKVCENSAKYFQLLTGDKTIGVSIRLAKSKKEKCSDKKSMCGGCNIFYKTYARSNNLNSLLRDIYSEEISIEDGIPRFLREKKEKGVLIYHDIEEAIKCGVYVPTKNDTLYPKDIVTMVVAPLNGWIGTKQDLIGIIYVISKRKNIFNITHTDSVSFIADLTASVIVNYTQYMSLINKKNNR